MGDLRLVWASAGCLDSSFCWASGGGGTNNMSLNGSGGGGVFSRLCQAVVRTATTAAGLSSASPSVRQGCTWRDQNWKAAWPNRLKHLTHRKHFTPCHTYGVQKQGQLRVVDNSKIGRQAMAEGK